jgi:putative transposase
MKSLIKMIPQSKALSIRQQCTLLCVSRSNFYYQPKQEKSENLEMMLLMDMHLLNHSTEGAVSMVYLLAGMGFLVDL